ncbi:amino acid permease [Aeromicrobium sp. UC242_57]|uniref:amino acid permease n=1 Tax=Aeromicrobium sp. UC242_57 TaxID=3374624 RepID=UPI00378AFCC5
MSWPARSRFEGVARRQVRRKDLLAHAIAVLTPSLSALGAGLSLPSVVGPGFWISTLAGFGLALLLSSILSEFAQRFASGGSLYTFTAKGLGPHAALIVGVSLLLGYGVLVGAGVTGAVQRSGSAWFALSGHQVSHGADLVGVVVVTVACVGIIAAGISFASRVALVVEAASIVVLAVVLGALVYRFGMPGWQALSLNGASPGKIVAGAALIATLTVAFESCAALGLEAERPMRDIPFAMRGGLLLTGGLFMAANAVGTVLPETMNVWSFRWFGIGQKVSPLDALVLVLLAASYVALAFCAWNALARLIFSFAREGVLPSVMGATTSRGVPWLAVAVVVPVVLVVPIVRWLSGETPSAGSWAMLRVATEVVSIAYGITAVALVFFLVRIDERPSTAVKAAVGVIGVVGVLAERFVAEAAHDERTMLTWLAAVVIASAVWRGAVTRRLSHHRAVLGAHEEPLASEVVLSRGAEPAP